MKDYRSNGLKQNCFTDLVTIKRCSTRRTVFVIVNQWNWKLTGSFVAVAISTLTVKEKDCLSPTTGKRLSFCHYRTKVITGEQFTSDSSCEKFSCCRRGWACFKGPGKRGHIVADTLLPVMFLWLRKLGNICCGHKMFLNKIRNIFCVPDTKFVSATNVARAGKRGDICVGNNVSATTCPCLPGP